MLLHYLVKFENEKCNQLYYVNYFTRLETTCNSQDLSIDQLNGLCWPDHTGWLKKVSCCTVIDISLARQ